MLSRRFYSIHLISGMVLIYLLVLFNWKLEAYVLENMIECYQG